MKARSITILLTLGFLLASAGSALGHATDEQKARREAWRARFDEIHAARHANLESFLETRADVLAGAQATHEEIKRRFFEARTRIQEECAALHAGEGAENARRQCVRDGMLPLVAKARAEHWEAHAAARARLLEARHAAIAAFLHERATILENHPVATV